MKGLLCLCGRSWRNKIVSEQVLRVLLVEDNANDAELILRELNKANGYQIVHERVEDEDGFKRALHKFIWDFIICDYSLPHFSAERVLELVEGYGLDTPFILVSGKITHDQASKVLGRRTVRGFISKGDLSNFGALFRREIELSRRYDAALQFFVQALGIRDQETKGHSERVTDMTVKLARALGIAEIEIIHIRRGALIHDIGKVGVPDSLLLKAGTLDEDETVRMRQHPRIGYDLLVTNEWMRHILDIPYCHHERWDGLGYPRGLKGEEIPMAARIFSVVDNFDALTSDRPYRSAWSRENALSYIRDQRGKMFDPAVVEVFLRMMGDG